MRIDNNHWCERRGNIERYKGGDGLYYKERIEIVVHFTVIIFENKENKASSRIQYLYTGDITTEQIHLAVVVNKGI